MFEICSTTTALWVEDSYPKAMTLFMDVFVNIKIWCQMDFSNYPLDVQVIKYEKPVNHTRLT